MKLRWENFKGEIPRMSRRLLPVGACETATNLDVFSGELRPFGGLSLQALATKGAAARTIWLYDSKYWLNWTTPVHVAKGLAADDSTLKRIYWTGDGAPKKASFASAIPADQNADIPAVSYPMGVVAPTAAPALTVLVAGSVYLETRTYLYTFVTSWGEESAPSPPSANLDVKVGEIVQVTGLPTAAPAGYPTVVTKRIYRTRVGNDSTSYAFVAEVDLSVAEFPDILATADLGAALPSLGYDEPPTDMAGLVTLANGIMAGFAGKQVMMCEPFQPHAWPVDYRYTVDDDIVALSAIGASIVVLTTGFPYVFTVRHPADITQERIPARQPCLSARSVSATLYGVVYASPDGLVAIQPGMAEVATKMFLTRKDWQLLHPETLIGVVHDARYVGFHQDRDGPAYTGFMFDPAENMLVNLDFDVDGIYADLSLDKLFLLIAGSIYAFDEVDQYRESFLAKLGPQVTEKPVNFGAAAVYANYSDIPSAADQAAVTAANAVIAAANAALWADTTWDEGAIGGAPIGFLPIAGDSFQTPIVPVTRTLTLKLFADGAQKMSRLVTSEDPVRLPGGFLAREWAVQLEGHIAVQRVELAQQAGEL